MLATVSMLGFAKLNLFLDITGRREDGYHLLKMVMQTVDLADRVQLTLREDRERNVYCDDPQIVQGTGNIAYHAARAFFEALGDCNTGIDIRIKKRIPHQAGLGGGSADAAAVLAGLNILTGAPFTLPRLMEIGVSCGADVPFALHGGTVLAQGIGEQMQPLEALCGCPIVLVKPHQGISTKEAFTAYDSGQAGHALAIEPLLDAIARCDAAQIGAHLANRFEALCPLDEVRKIKSEMMRHGALGAVMTGSGSAVFGIFSDDKSAACCCNALRPVYSFAEVTRPTRCGARTEKPEEGVL